MTVFNYIINNKYILHQSNPDEALGSQDTLQSLTKEEQELLSLKPRNLSEQDKRKRKSLQRQVRDKRKHVEDKLFAQQTEVKRQK